LLYGEAIRNLRERLGLSQREFAQRLGIHKQMVSDVERGKQKRFNPEVERKIRDLFGFDPSLIPDEEARSDAVRIEQDGKNSKINNKNSKKSEGENCVRNDDRVRDLQRQLIIYYFDRLDPKDRDRAFAKIIEILTGVGEGY